MLFNASKSEMFVREIPKIFMVEVQLFIRNFLIFIFKRYLIHPKVVKVFLILI